MASWLVDGLAVGACLYVLTMIAFAVAGRGEAAKVVARFVPDCVVLFGRLMRDPRVPRRRKLLVVTLLPYLAMPFDLVPDFIPVAGQLDDAVMAGRDWPRAEIPAELPAAARRSLGYRIRIVTRFEMIVPGSPSTQILIR